MLENVFIREVKIEDSDFLYFLYTMREPYDVISPIRKEEQDKFVINYLENNEDHPFKKWCIIEYDSNPIGSLTLNKNNNELGFWIIHDFQGKGIGSYAIKKFMEMNNEKSYTMKAHKSNLRSQHIAEKLGFNFSHYYYTYNN